MWREATQSETVLVRAILSFYHPPIEYCYFQVDDGEKNAVCLYSRTKSPSLIHTWLNQIKQMKWGISSISSLLTLPLNLCNRPPWSDILLLQGNKLITVTKTKELFSILIKHSI